MQTNKPLKQLNRKQKNLIFYIIMMAYPFIQFCIFYIGVNINSILLAFKQYDFAIDGFDNAGFNWVGFENFTDVFSRFQTDNALSSSLKNSLVVYAVTTIVMATLTIWFAYYLCTNNISSFSTHISIVFCHYKTNHNYPPTFLFKYILIKKEQ